MIKGSGEEFAGGGVCLGGKRPGLVCDVPLSGLRRRDLAEGGVYEALGAEGEN